MKARYALKALSFIAAEERGGLVQAGDVAEREAIPRKFLDAILRELRQQGFIDSRKGRGGGWVLRREAASISIASVLRAIDGPLAPVPCLSQTAYARCEGCHDERSCGLRLVLGEAHEASLRVLESTTLADLKRRTEQARASGPPVLRYAI